MLQPFGKFASGLAVLTVLALLMVVPAQKVATAQEAETAPGDTSGEAGVFGYAGGFVRGKRACTQTTATTIPESGTAWVTLPLANLSYTVPAGTTDLFNVAFSAECRLVNSVLVPPPGDYVRIRITDTVGAVTTFLEPYDGNQAFCSANALATHKGNWVKRAQAGAHLLRVQFQIVDGAPLGALAALIDDWTFEVVIYD